jgi:hypothetical protein
MLDLELVTTWLILLAMLAVGSLAVWYSSRWYRTLKQSGFSTGDDLAQLDRALDDEDELDPQEIERIRAAIQKSSDEERHQRPEKEG